jgi:hypothetical protein
MLLPGWDQEGKNNELAFVHGSPTRKGEPGHFGKFGVRVGDKTCHLPPENLVL